MNNTTFIFKQDSSGASICPIERNQVIESINTVVAVLMFSVEILGTHEVFSQQSIHEVGKKIPCEWRMSPSKTVVLATENSRLKKRLDVVIDSCKDDEEFLPIGDKSIGNFESLLSYCPDNLLKNWHLFPNNNGTLSLQYKDGDSRSSIISIGYELISYSITNGPLIHIVGKEPFSIQSVQSLLERMK